MRRGVAISPVTKLEWAHLRSLATDVTSYADVNSRGHAAARRAILRYLAKLGRKYGKHQDILATKADFCWSDRTSIALLLEAYELARKASDMRNRTYISSHLAGLYALNVNDKRKALRWLRVLESDLKEYWSSSDAHWLRYLKKYIS